MRPATESFVDSLYYDVKEAADDRDMQFRKQRYNAAKTWLAARLPYTTYNAAVHDGVGGCSFGGVRLVACGYRNPSGNFHEEWFVVRYLRVAAFLCFKRVVVGQHTLNNIDDLHRAMVSDREARALLRKKGRAAPSTHTEP